MSCKVFKYSLKATVLSHLAETVSLNSVQKASVYIEAKTCQRLCNQKYNMEYVLAHQLFF